MFSFHLSVGSSEIFGHVHTDQIRVLIFPLCVISLFGTLTMMDSRYLYRINTFYHIIFFETGCCRVTLFLSRHQDTLEFVTESLGSYAKICTSSGSVIPTMFTGQPSGWCQLDVHC